MDNDSQPAPSRAPAPPPQPYVAFRRDGWTAARQLAFLEALHVTRSVARSAASVGMSITGVYNLRRRPGAARFADAWDSIMASPPPGPRPVYQQPEFMPDRVEIVYRMGKPVGLRRRPDTRRLTARIAYLDRLADKSG